MLVRSGLLVYRSKRYVASIKGNRAAQNLRFDRSGALSAERKWLARLRCRLFRFRVSECGWETKMTIASDLLQRHFQTLVEDNAQWLTLIADDLVWELPFAPALGHPGKLSGRAEVVRHITWFIGAVENFRFFDLNVYAFADPDGAVAQVKAEGLIKPTGRIYRQEYVLFLRAADGKIAFLREYFDPTRAAKALNTPILGLES
jgi:ketosteroid isomerase-like protein